jgi:hypothetical protein
VASSAAVSATRQRSTSDASNDLHARKAIDCDAAEQLEDQHRRE